MYVRGLYPSYNLEQLLENDMNNANKALSRNLPAKKAPGYTSTGFYEIVSQNRQPYSSEAFSILHIIP